VHCATGSMTIHNILSIAGTDPSGGAGICADLKTFSALGSYGTAVITAVVAQNTHGVRAVHQLPGDVVSQQLETLLEDVRIDAVKIGMLGTAEVVLAVTEVLRRHQLPSVVLDPVMVAKSGDRLLAADAVRALREELLPWCDLVTPNLPEAADLLGEDEATDEEAMWGQLARLAGLTRGVLLKGGHLDGADSVDLLRVDGQETRLSARRIITRNTHGTGCTLSAAIAALRPQRCCWPEAVMAAKTYLTGAITAAGDLHVGTGHGPTHHFHSVWPTLDQTSGGVAMEHSQPQVHPRGPAVGGCR
jgi:hydroxymethylpyrimidine/phosphomethylpyrimidine kinase